MQIQQHFETLIKHIYNFKILVSASQAAKNTLVQKGLSPALFLRPFYKESNSNSIKFDFNLIDIEDYKRPDQKSYAQKSRSFLNSYFLNTKNIEKSRYKNRNDVQDHINNQNFLWFLQASKLYLETTSFDFRVTTIDQPFGVIQILSVQDEDFNKQYFKVSQQTNATLKYGYSLNSSQMTKVQTMIIILIDRSKNKTIQQALKYTQILKKQYKHNGNLIYRLEINNNQSVDLPIWATYMRNSYAYKINLKQSDTVCVISNYSYQQMLKTVHNHKQLIYTSISKRYQYLTKQFRQFSKTTNKLFGSIFGSSSITEKDRYSTEQQQCRQFADLLFLFGDHKRAYQAYKQIVGKFETRNKIFYVSLLEMMNHCLVLSKTGIKNDPYSYIQKDARIILYSSNQILFIKYSIFMIYSCYTLKIFKRQFIKDFFYLRLKQKLRDNLNNPSIYISILMEQQYATFHLNYSEIQYRFYANALLKTGTHFSDCKLQSNAYRCFLVIQNIYRNTFNVIQIFIYTYLAKICLENKNYNHSIIYLRKGWNSMSNKISQDRYIQFNNNYIKIMTGLEEQGAANLFQKENVPIKFINIIGFDVSTQDEIYQEKISKISSYKNSNQNNQNLDRSWNKMGELYFGNDNKSKSINSMQFKKLQSFDCKSIQQKYLSFRFKSAVENDKIIQKNARVCFINEKIRFQVYLFNQLNKQIDVTKCRPIISGSNGDFLIEPQLINFKMKGNTQKLVQFTLTPKKSGIFQIQKLLWTFNKLQCSYAFPKYYRKTQKNYYFKLNVKQATGRLKIIPKTENINIFLGEIYNLNLIISNQGKQQISSISIIVQDPRIFGFSIKKIDKLINPKQKIIQQFKIRPYDKRKQKIKMLFIYKTNQLSRIKRFCLQIHPQNLLEMKQLKCQKLSSHIHLLTFQITSLVNNDSLSKSINILDDSPSAKQIQIQQISFSSGFRILKFQTTKIHHKINYTIFLQKNVNMPAQSYSFKNKRINNQLYQIYIDSDQQFRSKQWLNYQNKYFPYDHPDRMNLILIFSYQNRIGIYHPQKFATNPKLLKILDNKRKIQDYLLPFDFKIVYPTEVIHNFDQNPFKKIDAEIIIKNIFTQKTMQLIVQFVDGDELGDSVQSGYWEGQTSKRFSLQKDQQIKLKIGFVVCSPGIYDLSKIRYTLLKEKSKTPAVIMHSIYEKLHLQVKQSKQIKQMQQMFFDFTKSKPIPVVPVAKQFDLLI